MLLLGSLGKLQNVFYRNTNLFPIMSSFLFPPSILSSYLIIIKENFCLKIWRSSEDQGWRSSEDQGWRSNALLKENHEKNGIRKALTQQGTIYLDLTDFLA